MSESGGVILNIEKDIAIAKHTKQVMIQLSAVRWPHFEAIKLINLFIYLKKKTLS